MPELDKTEIERYLKSVIGSDTRVLNLQVLGKSEEKDIKGYGYGTPVQIDYEYDGKQRRAVLHTISPGPFGHEHMSDRAQMLLWDHKAFNLLPRATSGRSMPAHSDTTGPQFRSVMPRNSSY